MFKHATCLTLALIALLELSSARRLPRSIWPFSSQPAQEKSLISAKHAEILRQNGFGEYLDLSTHPIWKIHKYEGIDLKPVQVETEIIKSAGREEQVPQLLDARNPVSNVAPLTESQADDQLATDLPADLSLLNNWGLAYMLSDYDEDQQETGKASALADAIANEEQSHPGFFAKLWSMLWGSSESSVSKDAVAEGIEDDSALLQIALPATRENYAEISLIQPTTHGAQVAIQQSVNQANQYAFTAGANAGAVVSQPVTKWYQPTNGHFSPADAQFSRTQSWVQSWNPNAAYNVHVQGPSNNPAEHVGTVQVQYTNARNDLQGKVSEDEGVVAEQASDLKNVEEKADNTPNVEQIETVLAYTADTRNHFQRKLLKDESAVVEQNNVPKNREEKADEAPILAEIESVKEEAANASDDSSRNASGNEEESSANINHTTQRIASEDEPKEKADAVTEGQVQQVAGELESSSVAQPELQPTLRQKAVNALKMGLVPQKFLRQLQLSEQEINDFINNSGNSNKTWDKIRGHLNKLGPLSPKVRRWFFV